MTDLQFTQIDHLGASVWDADAARTFYDVVDVPVVLDEVLEGYNIRAVFLDFDGVLLEFLEPTGPGNVKTYLERHGPGFQHVAYRVPDLDRFGFGTEVEAPLWESSEAF